jgi:hypothetical protein
MRPGTGVTPTGRQDGTRGRGPDKTLADRALREREDRMKVSLNKSQYRALNDLRGLPEAAHMLLMCSLLTDTGGVLEGDEEAFAELVSFIGAEMAEDMLSATASRSLRTLCLKIDPGCAEWLGM